MWLRPVKRKQRVKRSCFVFFFCGSPKNFLLIQGGLHFLRLRDLVTHWDRFRRESCGAPCRSWLKFVDQNHAFSREAESLRCEAGDGATKRRNSLPSFFGLIGSLQHTCTGDVMHRECILSPAALSWIPGRNGHPRIGFSMRSLWQTPEALLVQHAIWMW